MRELTIGKNDAGQRLDRFVAKSLPLLPPALLQKYIRLKRIKVNGKGAKQDTRLLAGDILQLYINDEFFAAAPQNPAPARRMPALKVVYEDEEIGRVTKVTYSYCLDKNIGYALVDNSKVKPGDKVMLHGFEAVLCDKVFF